MMDLLIGILALAAFALALALMVGNRRDKEIIAFEMATMDGLLDIHRAEHESAAQENEIMDEWLRLRAAEYKKKFGVNPPRRVMIMRVPSGNPKDNKPPLNMGG